MPGIRIRHATARSTCHVVPVVSIPYADGGFICPTCHVLHPVKSVHLWLDDRGECLVSEGVLGELAQAGMPGLEVVGGVKNPPPLYIRKGASREQLDYENRQIRIMEGQDNG